jgi:hypothetical protein
VKTIPLAGVLIALFIAHAVAQNFSSETKASLDPLPARESDPDSPQKRVPGPPSYCKPCLFYAGDFDSNASDANGLANEMDVFVSTGAAVYTPFIVPKAKTWTVTGLFTNNGTVEMPATLDPKVIPYEVRKNIPKDGGTGGELICHGRKLGTLTLSQSTDFNLFIYATRVRNIKGCRLSAGKYWLSVVPYCTNNNNNNCTYWRMFLMNDDGAMAYRFGPLEPANNSFFNSEYFGAVWEPTSEQQTSKRFSAGVEGTAR